MISSTTVEGYRQLCIFSLRRAGVLQAPCSTSWVWSHPETGAQTGRIGLTFSGSALHLNYRVGSSLGEWQDVSDIVFLKNTTPTKGGKRWWFQCPSCNARRAKLYLNTYFRCRACMRLSYASQSEDRYSRAMRRFFKRRRALGAFGGTCEPFPDKPKWMRWDTYGRLCEEDWRDLSKIDGYSVALLDQLKASLSRAPARCNLRPTPNSLKPPTHGET